MTPILTLGTRGSPLALTQARLTAEALTAAHGWPEGAIAIVPVRTTGDIVQDRPLAEIGGKALWTKELDRALLDGRIDIAVHSMKDVETFRPASLRIGAVLPRADVRDRLIGASSLAALPPGARVGTSSPRRAAQVRARRPDVSILSFRGNVATRLGRLAAGEADATLLAAAGLDRLDQPQVGSPVALDEMLPAPAQGAIGIEARADDERVLAWLAAIDHSATHLAVGTERALLMALDGTCRSPIAAHARLIDDEIWLDAEILSPDGSERHAGHVRARPEDAPAAATLLATDLLGRASPHLRRLFGQAD